MKLNLEMDKKLNIKATQGYYPEFRNLDTYGYC